MPIETAKVTLVVTTRQGPVAAGTIIMHGGVITGQAEPGHETLMRTVMSSPVVLREGKVKREDNPEKWFRGLPYQYHGSYLQAELFEPAGKTLQMELVKALTELLNKPVLCIDFDATIQRGDPRDPLALTEPIDGALDALRELSQDFEIAIFTARDDFQPVWEWLKRYAATAYVSDVTNQKPSDALLFIDDRGFTFKGNWDENTVRAIEQFKPYWES